MCAKHLIYSLLRRTRSREVTRDTPMENESKTEKQIRRRSIGDDGCREMVSIICEEEKKRLPFKKSIALLRTMQERWIRLLLQIKDAIFGAKNMIFLY